jgi:hypothetical protein
VPIGRLLEHVGPAEQSLFFEGRGLNVQDDRQQAGTEAASPLLGWAANPNFVFCCNNQASFPRFELLGFQNLTHSFEQFTSTWMIETN